MSRHCGKAFLYFYNLLYLGIAAVLVYLAVVFVKAWADYTRLTTSTYAIVPAGIILGVAIVLLVASIIGCCGTCSDNRCCLGVFFTFLLALFIMELVFGSLAYVYRDQIKTEVNKDLTKALHEYPSAKKGDIIKKGIDKMQHSLRCCGVDGPDDWKNLGEKKYLLGPPTSCCRHTGTAECYYEFKFNVYQVGCYKQLLVELEKKSKYIAGVGIGFAIFQVIGMMGTCYLLCTMHKVSYNRIHDPPRA